MFSLIAKISIGVGSLVAAAAGTSTVINHTAVGQKAPEWAKKPAKAAEDAVVKAAVVSYTSTKDTAVVGYQKVVNLNNERLARKEPSYVEQMVALNAEKAKRAADDKELDARIKQVKLAAMAKVTADRLALESAAKAEKAADKAALKSGATPAVKVSVS